jgi:hypothetical protein
VVTVPDIVVTVLVRELAQVGPATPPDAIVTAPALYARARPFKIEPPFNWMPETARIFPMIGLVVSRVAALPTCHHTLHGSPPTILAPGLNRSVLTVLKIQTPDPLRMSVPDNEKEPAEQ